LPAVCCWQISRAARGSAVTGLTGKRASPLRFDDHNLTRDSATHLHYWLAITLAAIVAFSKERVSSNRSLQDDLRALGSEWIYVEDRTEGRIRGFCSNEPLAVGENK
jgi:hypothetical protein